MLENRIIAGDYDSEWELKKKFDELPGMTLVCIDSGPMWADLVMIFDSGFQIELFCTDQEHESWELFGPESSYQSRQDGVFGAVVSAGARTLTSTELLLSSHEEAAT